MKKKIAIIFGISGQDGSLLAKFLIKKNYIVYGTSRFAALVNLKKLNFDKKIKLFKLKKNSKKNIEQILIKTKCDEIYYLSGQSSVKASEKLSFETIISNNLPLVHILDYLRKTKKKIKLFNASSAEIFGNLGSTKCNENTQYDPRSFYALSKVISLELTKTYRNQFKIWACNGIMFNHESSLRSEKFVIKKIINSARKISQKRQKKLTIGDINISRDWGWAPEYVRGMWLILNYKKPDDFVLATGKNNKLKDVIKKVFFKLNLNYKNYIKISKKNFRKNEIKITRADISKAKKLLKWNPKMNINFLIGKMMNNKL